MNSEDRNNESKMTRRTFIGVMAVASAATAIPFAGGLQKASAQDMEQLDDAGDWRTASCASFVCGSGRCINKVLVKNNTIIRQKTDDTKEDNPLNPQQRGCLRGRSQRKGVMGADRLKYPMKRKHWEPGGGQKELRGKDSWERISWDEALDYVGAEFVRIKEQYGNGALAATWAYGFPQLWHAFGGIHRFWGPISLGAWSLSITKLTGNTMYSLYQGVPNSINDRLDLQNAKLVVMWGCNPAWSVASSVYIIKQAKKAGAKFIFVDPMYSDSAVAFADEWIPIRPSTDTALLLGMAHYMISNDLHDQSFLDTYTTGFDAAHMPESADRKDNFKDYVLGTYDDIPKTPEWASEICGTPVDVIKSFAQQIATTKPLAFLSAYAPARSNNGEQFCQAFMTVGWMTGNVGKPGACVGVSSNVNAFNQGPMMVTYGASGLPTYPNAIMPFNYSPVSSPPPDDETWHSPVIDEAWEAIVTGKYHAGTRGVQPIDIHLITHMGPGNALNQFPNVNRGIEAHRKVDFVVTSDLFPTPCAQYSDIVLPVTHCWERFGTFNGLNIHNRESYSWGSRIVEPMFEAKDDAWIEKELSKRMGIDPEEYMPFGPEQAVINAAATSKVLKSDGQTYENLVSITKEDLVYYGVKGEPQEGRIPIRDLQKEGFYHADRAVGDNFAYIAFESYIQDPVANPLSTSTGKFEIYCKDLSDTIAGYGYTTISPIPKYQPVNDGYEDAQKGPYPLQIVTPHYMRRAHSSCDNNPWLREAFTQEVFMNATDAKTRGLKDKDTVRIYNEHGATLRQVTVTERIMPGVVAMGEGAWFNIDEETGYDTAGCTNVLMGSHPNGQGTQPFNTNIVEIEKHSKEIIPDYLVPPKEIV